ncbi:hypothetical protein AAE02nite_15400 [Adhaeribacter aerolatus]|uniref:Uncharacterized protein n=1 Tax=Adhaeribacter aerolatus TaxID=670289 RepID=A0A512AVY1_9BACT|nr:DUF5995 family protein [Adhaeribacter aerolatus]GEO03876.1 hypothetical protein AAE02nite_15400 [Adhaeribacter aerolatus]
MIARTIDEVISALEEIIQDCIRTNNRAGYFAMVYYCTTLRVKKDILLNNFEDGPRMERFDVLFANYYLRAWHQWQAGKPTAAAWEIVFETAAHLPAVLMQHLLLGMNAHINLDLGTTAVETMRDGRLPDIRRDFNSINTILGAMIDKVQENIGRVSPLMGLLDLHARNRDELLVQFSINLARDGAWRFAEDLHDKVGADYQTCLAARDNCIAQLGKNLASPRGFLLKYTLKAIRATERLAPGEIINILKVI